MLDKPSISIGMFVLCLTLSFVLGTAHGQPNFPTHSVPTTHGFGDGDSDDLDDLTSSPGDDTPPPIPGGDDGTLSGLGGFLDEDPAGGLSDIDPEEWEGGNTDEFEDILRGAGRRSPAFRFYQRNFGSFSLKNFRSFRKGKSVLVKARNRILLGRAGFSAKKGQKLKIDFTARGMRIRTLRKGDKGLIIKNMAKGRGLVMFNAKTKKTVNVPLRRKRR